MVRPDPPDDEPRFSLVSRRAFFRGGASAAAAAAVLGLAACGNRSDAVLVGATTPPTSGRATSTSSTTTPSTNTSSGDTDVARALTGEMTVAFSFVPSGGRVNDPYIAVWIEDDAGELVRTLALWFLQDQKGTRWLSDLRRWSSTDGSQETIDTVSGATRTPGDYSLVWDLTDLDDNAVSPGDFYVCIEAAREHGPYSLIREAIALDDGLDTALSPDGELTDASVRVVA